MSLAAPTYIQPLLGKPVAILGGGLSGRATALLLSRLGAASTIYDEKGGAGDKRSFSQAEAREHALAVFSPGFRVEHPWLLNASCAGCRCLGEMDFASLFWKGRILAVTGTNGKTTLTEFATHALRHSGIAAFACGNIGHSFSLLALERDGGAGETAVCEVSSFQAETFSHFAADAAIWTNHAEDHLERHPGMKAYFSAKYEVLARCSRGASVAGSSVARFAAELGFVLPEGSAVASEGQPAVAGLEGTVFAEYPQRENYILLGALWSRLGLDAGKLLEAAQRFHLGRHRLAEVADVAGVHYWNDSKATNFHAVEAALSRFSSPIILIAGGKAKGGDISGFVQRIAPRVKHMLLIGDTKGSLAAACREQDLCHSVCLTLEEAVQKAAELATPGDQVLLSPGFASFDMFRGYDHRGEIFEQLVKNLALAIAVTTREL